MAFMDLTRARVRAAVAAVRDEALDVADEAEETMKRDHPWQNDTGAAEASLYARVHVVRGGQSPRYRIDLGYDDEVMMVMNPVEYARVGNYGQVLETVQGGAFAIVQPTADQLRVRFGRRALNRIAQVLR